MLFCLRVFRFGVWGLAILLVDFGLFCVWLCVCWCFLLVCCVGFGVIDLLVVRLWWFLLLVQWICFVDCLAFL